MDADTKLTAASLAMAAVSMGVPKMVLDWLKSGDFADFPADIRPHLLYLYLTYLRGTEHYEELLAAAKIACSVLCGCRNILPFRHLFRLALRGGCECAK